MPATALSPSKAQGFSQPVTSSGDSQIDSSPSSSSSTHSGTVPPSLQANIVGKVPKVNAASETILGNNGGEDSLRGEVSDLVVTLDHSLTLNDGEVPEELVGPIHSTANKIKLMSSARKIFDFPRSDQSRVQAESNQNQVEDDFMTEANAATHGEASSNLCSNGGTEKEAIVAQQPNTNLGNQQEECSEPRKIDTAALQKCKDGRNATEQEQDDVEDHLEEFCATGDLPSPSDKPLPQALASIRRRSEGKKNLQSPSGSASPLTRANLSPNSLSVEQNEKVSSTKKRANVGRYLRSTASSRSREIRGTNSSDSCANSPAKNVGGGGKHQQSTSKPQSSNSQRKLGVYNNKVVESRFMKAAAKAGVKPNSTTTQAGGAATTPCKTTLGSPVTTKTPRNTRGATETHEDNQQSAHRAVEHKKMDAHRSPGREHSLTRIPKTNPELFRVRGKGGSITESKFNSKSRKPRRLSLGQMIKLKEEVEEKRRLTEEKEEYDKQKQHEAQLRLAERQKREEERQKRKEEAREKQLQQKKEEEEDRRAIAEEYAAAIREKKDVEDRLKAERLREMRERREKAKERRRVKELEREQEIKREREEAQKRIQESRERERELVEERMKEREEQRQKVLLQKEEKLRVLKAQKQQREQEDILRKQEEQLEREWKLQQQEKERQFWQEKDVLRLEEVESPEEFFDAIDSENQQI